MASALRVDHSMSAGNGRTAGRLSATGPHGGSGLPAFHALLPKGGPVRRDDDLMRQLMLDLEQADDYIHSERHDVEGYSRKQVAYHLALIIEAGFANGATHYPSTGGDPTIPDSVMVKRLTWAGHEHITNLSNDEVWAAVKGRAAKVGGAVSVEVLGELAKAVVKNMIGLP